MSEQTPWCRLDRRRRPRIGSADASGLWPKIQMLSEMQQSFISLHLYLPILRPSRRKTELLPSLGSRPSGSRYLCRRVLLGHISPTGFFSQHPPTEKVSAARCQIERFAAASGAQSFAFAKCSSHLPPPLRLFRAHIECDDITPCSVSVAGRAPVAAAVQPWLCQWLHICSARAALLLSGPSLMRLVGYPPNGFALHILSKSQESSTNEAASCWNIHVCVHRSFSFGIIGH